MVRYSRWKIGQSFIQMRYFVLESQLLAYYKGKPQVNQVCIIPTSHLPELLLPRLEAPQMLTLDRQDSSIGFGAPVCANMRSSRVTDAFVLIEPKNALGKQYKMFGRYNGDTVIFVLMGLEDEGYIKTRWRAQDANVLLVTFALVYVGTTLKDLLDVTHGWNEVSTTNWEMEMEITEMDL